MSLTFHLNEIFDIAVRTERNGAEFYRKAAALYGETENCEYLLQMAAMEEDHERTFRRMREETNAEPDSAQAFDPYNDGQRYIDALADGHGGEGSRSAADALTGGETMETILRTAIGLERNSILFYSGLLDVVAGAAARQALQDIIAEEKAHVVQLANALKQRADR